MSNLKHVGEDIYMSNNTNCLFVKIENSGRYKIYQPPKCKAIPIIGIYGLYDTVRDMWYIGSSKDILSRFNTHRMRFRNRRRYRCNLILLLNPCHDNNIKYVLLETCKERDLPELERYYIRLADSFNKGYNNTYITSRFIND